MKTFRIFVSLYFLIGTTGYCLAAGSSSVQSFEELRKKGNEEADFRLLEAANDLDIAEVKKALENGANPNANNAKDALEFGIDPKQLHLIRADTAINRTAGSNFLKSRNASFNERLESQNACIQILKLLFNSGAKIQRYDDTILYWPIIREYPRIVQLLLNKGANPNNTVAAMTFVELAEEYGYKDIVGILVAYGGKPVPPQEALQLHLIHATKYGTLIEMDKILQSGAQINKVTRLGRTALQSLLDYGLFDMTTYTKVSFLLQKGANPNLEAVLMMNKVPQIALHTVMLHSRAWKNNFPEGEEVYARLVIEALIKAGADVSAHGVNGATPLQIAVLYNNVMGAEILIKAGADVSGRGRDGLTPLHAAINTNLKLAEMLIEAGADVSAPMDIRGRFGTRREKLAESTYGGMTPLHIAAKYNNVVGAKMLIEAGCKLMNKDKDGKIPLDYAESAEMIKLLKSHGTKEE